MGSSPDGKVYRVNADGTSSTFFDPDDKYIWAIAVAPDGTTYVATGGKGKVYKVPAAGGSGALFYDAGTEHVSALAFDASGTLLVGTSTPGRVVRLDAAGKPFVLLETAYQEVRSLRVAGAVTYATAVGASSATGHDADAGRHARHQRHRHDVHRGDRHRRRRRPRGDVGPQRERRRIPRQRPAEGRHLPHRGGRRLDDRVGVRRRRALRRPGRARRQPPRRDRRQGQALSPRRRSGPCHAGDARRRPADHRHRRRRRRRHPARRVESGAPAPALGEAGGHRLLHLGCPRHDHGRHLGHDPLAGDAAGRDGDRAAHAQRQHPHAGRDVEPVVDGRSRPRPGRASRARRPGICSGRRC